MSVRISVCFVLLVEIVAGQICMIPNDFSNHCASQYGGVAVGGRCFFLARNPDKSLIGSAQWASSFGICQNQGGGAIFAQIYSESEMSAIWQKFSANITGYSFVWIPLRNLATVPKTPQTTPVITAGTHWHSDASTYDPQITANQTFLRNRLSDDVHPGDDVCFTLYQREDTKNIGIGDNLCVVQSPYNLPYRPVPLCMINNGKQDFELTAGSFMERPVQSEAGMAANQCATACSNQIWCRTFNYYCKTQSCDWFALHADDAEESVKSSDADCSMYTANERAQN